jgi:hypothetical protein
VSRVINLFQNLFKFGMPAYLILLPAMAIYGWIVPWPPANNLLSKYVDQTPLLVGASYRDYYSLGQARKTTFSRSYVLLPAVVSDPKTITLTQENVAPITISESRFGLFIMVIWLVLCLIGTWWFWFRRVPPNNSFKPSPHQGGA